MGNYIILKRGLLDAIPQVERELHLALSPGSSSLYGSERFSNPTLPSIFLKLTDAYYKN